MKTETVPDTGDLVWLTFDPQAGREQAGRRQAVILFPAQYNRKSGLAVVCPITSHIKGYPFEVLLPPNLPVSGSIFSDHLKSLDWRVRRAEPAGRVPKHVLQEVLDLVGALLRY